MRISIMTATGDDDLVNAEERATLNTARRSSNALDEVVDIEDMQSGISIMDLTE